MQTVCKLGPYFFIRIQHIISIKRSLDEEHKFDN